jgi:hypothetical protein
VPPMSDFFPTLGLYALTAAVVLLITLQWVH